MKKQFVITVGQAGAYHASATADRYPGLKVKRFFVDDRQEEYAAAYVPAFVPPVSTTALICEGQKHIYRSRSLTHCLQPEFLEFAEPVYKTKFAQALHERIHHPEVDLRDAITFLTSHVGSYLKANKIQAWEVNALISEVENLHPHRDIMTPAPELGEGIFAITQHLGEGRRQTVTRINGEAHMEGGKGLTQLELMIYNEAQMTAQGDPVVPHLDRSRRAWFKYAGGIKKHFGCTTAEAEELAENFGIIEVTAKTVKPLEAMLSTDFLSGICYVATLAKELRDVTDVDSPVLNMMETDQVDDDETMPPNPEVYHKLDDSRDLEAYWEDRQPVAFRQLLARIRTSDMTKLKAIGKSLFNEKSFTKTQLSVLWDEYHRRKANISPRLRKIALRALERLTDPTCDLKAVARWLHGDGATKLNRHELSVVWNSWRARQPKVTPDPMPITQEFDFSYPEDLMMAEEPSYLYD